MKRAALHFTRLTDGDIAQVRQQSAHRPLGTDVYTALFTDGAREDGPVWVGRDPAGAPQCVIFCGGAYRIRLARRGTASRQTGTDAPFFLPPKRRDTLCVMKKTGTSASSPETARALSGTALFSFFTLLAGDPAQNLSADEAYVETLRRANRGLADYFAIFEGDLPVSGGGIVSKNETYALIGNLYTRPDRRGRGYASDVLCACAEKAAGEGLIPLVICEKETAAFYKRRGWRRMKKNEL